MEHLKDEDIAAVAALLSSERLGTFQNSASRASTRLRRCHALLQTAFARSAALVKESA
jgi:hypothetical protein